MDDDLTSADLNDLLEHDGDVLGLVRRWCQRTKVAIYLPDDIERMIEAGSTDKIGIGTYGDCYRIKLSRSKFGKFDYLKDLKQSNQVDWVLKCFHGDESSDMLLREAKALHKVIGVPGVQCLVGVCPKLDTLITEYAGDTLSNFIEIQRKLNNWRV